jgi:hypothetical protein
MQPDYILITCFIVVIILALQWKNNKQIDNFNSIIRDYPPSLQHPRYGLRGDRLRVSDIRNKYIYPENHFRLNSCTASSR